MEQLINLITEKTGISAEQAQGAIDTVLGFVKDKLPEGMQGMVDSLIGGGGTDGAQSSGGDLLSQAGSMLGGMFGGDNK
jgi:hypothetical protein